MHPSDEEIDAARAPQHSIESESAVLGGLMLDPAVYDRVGDILTADDFYRAEHKLVFGAVVSLINASKPTDIFSVYAELESRGEGAAVGGVAYLHALNQYVPSNANLRRYAEIIRERAILRRLTAAGSEIIEASFARDGKTVEAIVEEAEKLVLAVGEAGARMKAGFVSMDKLMVELLDRTTDLAENPRDFTGTPTGFADLDKLTSGMQDGDLIILAARPSMGKTSLAINIAENVALDRGLPVAVFSMEMGAAQLATRIASSIGRLDQSVLRTGKLSPEDWSRLSESAEKLMGASLHIDESPGLTPSEVRAAARRLHRQCGGKLGLVVVDYLQLMTTSSKDENRATAVGEISRGLKMLAKELKCPVVALSQLSRGVESRTDKRPMMSDLRESGAIEQDADVIMFIYRDDYYNKDSKEPGVAEVIISKQRSGPTGTAKLFFQKALTKFENLAYGSPDL